MSSELPGHSTKCANDMIHDWTESLPKTDHVRFFKTVDWTQTVLGETQQWSVALRMYTQMVMSDTRAACLYWGPTRVAIYNESFVPLAAGAHPTLMGQSFASGFPELDPFIRPLFEEGIKSGVAQDVVESPMMVQRNSYREEAFFTGNFTPVRGVDGDIEGFYNALFEVTSQIISDRRKRMLNMLTTPRIFSTDAVFEHIIASLATAPLDVPMALLFEADNQAEPGKTILRVRGQLGIPEGHTLLLDGQELTDTTDIAGVASLCRQANDGKVLTTRDSRFESVDWLGFKMAPETIVTMALRTSRRLFGFLVIGTNPYRPFDDASEQFTTDLMGTASNLLAAALDADNLRKEQQQLQNELEFSDLKVRHLVEHASIGMAHAKPDGTLLWANDKFLSLAGLPTEKRDEINSMFEVLVEDDQDQAHEVWTRIFHGDDHVSAEFRLKQAFHPPVGGQEPAQVQLLAFPFKEHGATVSGMACITDISHLKWAEAWQARAAQEARDAKRQQEAFIDVVSHEMRNPLSAIVHCADSISMALNDVKAKGEKRTDADSLLEALEANASAASIILDCCKHQKRIIDDVLTLSRLEETLLTVKPAAAKPSELVASVIAMFGAELRAKSISTEVIAESSLAKLNIDHLYFDQSRVVQIFINLLTNAIKFMRADGEKSLKIQYGATATLPRIAEHLIPFPADIHWAPKGEKASGAVVDGPEWGLGEVIYMVFSLSDTGIGMRTAEVDKIFQRFEQANVTTHVTYGGSGLGLFISKELTERMGGEIGVQSVPDKGSTFVFYIKTRRANLEPKKISLPLRRPSLPASRPSQIRTLLVEDNVINQKVLRHHLQREDCAVQVANHGLEALEMMCAPGAHFDVVLMDIQMPVMDGLTATREIRNLEQDGTLQGRTPIIAVTANVRQEQIECAVAAGADHVVQKPFMAKKLVGLMRELLGRGIDKEDSR
ncbi:hypothetical protein HBI23_142600 [Parastagonospora nodorum]|nr:hypothetical protein HBI79_125340 [Parastagonospora nodorum]KAH5415589.1 hypothetical protein HBI47_149100 [Parastagonospora nodorum]KAH5657740.1 hypothetical protein HBI23_142600 [Parastagonospora nodorum]